MAEDRPAPAGSATEPAASGNNLAKLAAEPSAAKPAGVAEKEWRKHRQAAGNMVVIKSHFKSIYLIPMAVISLACGIVDAFTAEGRGGGSSDTGLVWTLCFCFYMNLFIFEWSRSGTFILIATIVALVAIGTAINSDEIPIWHSLGDFLANLNLKFSQTTFFFFAIFFSLCAFASWVRTQFHYVVVESNEIQIYRNALFGDRERVSMLNPRVEVRVPDMLEYFHPGYNGGQIIIHAPDRTIVLDNVLHIRRIEKQTDRLGSALSVRVQAS